jgi:hypothetical protein
VIIGWNEGRIREKVIAGYLGLYIGGVVNVLCGFDLCKLLIKIYKASNFAGVLIIFKHL